MFEEIRDPAARIRALGEHASRLTDVDVNIGVSKYFRSGKELLRMADVYCHEGSYEEAFILFSKFVTLFVEKLPKHPGYKAASLVEKAENKKKLSLVFPAAEALKAKLREKYGAEEKVRKAEEEKRAAEVAREIERLRVEEERAWREKERSREEEARRTQELERRLLLEAEEQLRQMQEANRRSLENDRRAAMGAGMGPAGEQMSNFDALPPPPSYNSATGGGLRPEIPSRSLKPGTTSPGRSGAHGGGLKMVYVPEPLVRHFLELASANTARAVETCGILCGKLAHSTWRITHLLMPQQCGTADSCDIANEEDVAEYQDQQELITLGWIHTHPTQTAFLSSVDQHTHWPFQKLLPEAIAIVCSPKFNETGFFYLTPDYGMDFIRGCNGRGFHEHPKHTPIFDTCPHVQVDNSASVLVVDLRRK